MRIDGERLTSVRWLTWILASLALTYVIARAFPARAHGDFDWIARHYGAAAGFDADFKGCCGKQDCFPVEASFDRATGKWTVRDRFGGAFADKDLNPSHDPQGRHWRCYVMRRDLALGLVPERPRTDAQGKPCFFPSRGDF